MRKYILSMGVLLLFPILASAEFIDEGQTPNDSDDETTELAEGTIESYPKQTRYNQNWDKNPQARHAFLAGPESYQNYHDRNRSTSGRDYISSVDESQVPKNNPKWYRNNEGRKAYLRGEKDYRSYSSPNRPGSSKE